MDEQPWPVPHAVGRRVLYAHVAIVLPIPCFLLAGVLRPEWQSGALNAYAALLLDPGVTLFFSPLLAYAAVCLALLLIAPGRLARFLVVRLGIYGGFFLALQYTVLLSIALGGSYWPLLLLGVLVLGALPLALAWLYTLGRRKWGDRWTRLLALGLAGMAAIAIVVTSVLFYGIPLIILIILLFASTPIWCLLIAALVSFRLLRDYELPGRLSAGHVGGALAWLGAFGAAWRFAVLRMGEAYAALPAQQPGCYVATAAANGHPRLVRSWPAGDQSGRPFRANRQLQRLKCAELALQAAWPAGHRRLRRAYDAVGPRLAGRLRHPLLADAAYLLLKPAEWGSWAVLRALFPQAEAVAGRLYVDFCPSCSILAQNTKEMP